MLVVLVSRRSSSLCESILISNVDDNSKGYFIKPTVIVTKDPKSLTMTTEIFGPVLTVRFSFPASVCTYS